MPERTVIFPIAREKEIFKIAFCFSEYSFPELLTVKNEFLHPNELSVFDSFEVKERQYSFLQGRYAAKKALANLKNYFLLKNILIEKGIFYQPIVKNILFQNINISISHSDRFAAALAFPEDLVAGIDIELIDDEKDWCAIFQWNDCEKEWIKEFNKIEVVMWCSKEALAKALKTGFTAALDIFEISHVEQGMAHWIVKFKYFPHFTAYSWQINACCFCIVLPANLEINLPILMASIQTR
ncbi:4'-phosphopantetheinyl transferase family protein [Chryseobacterium sp. CBSDS_008]|uniref:4'-phosphopantetheinyl transferase family protein n=1 Tax=Chryseobacterium sp. CBSDS_008 TaxID=3415265 RepID=UPI003CF8C0C5